MYQFEGSLTFFRQNYYSHLGLLLLLLALAGCSRRGRRDNLILATIGEHNITIADFTSRYQQVQERVNLPDNGDVRNETFRNLIDEELLIYEARRTGYLTDARGQYTKEKLRIQELLNKYLQNLVFTKIVITDKELKELFVRLNTRVKARHLYASTKLEADSLFTELMTGNTYKEMAWHVFSDPRLRETGGSLGFFTVDEMDPALEEAAFSLKIGEISEPIRTATGYSILQVQDRITKPLLTEAEFARHKSKLKDYWLLRKRKQTAQLYVDSLRQYLNISFNKEVLEEVMRVVRGKMAAPDNQERFFILEEDPLNNRRLVSSKLGDWDVITFYHYANFTSSRQIKRIRNTKNMEDFIAGLVVRVYILSEAEKMELDQAPDFEQSINRELDNYLLKRMDQVIADATVIPEDSLRAYFQENRGSYIIPPKVQLREIILEDEATAQEISAKLETGIPFEELAERYSVRRSSAEKGGEIGSFTYKELGAYGDVIFSLDAGQWTGPVNITTQHAFFKCISKDSGKVQSFAEARPLIEKSLNIFYRQREKQQLLSRIRKQVKVITYPEKLRSIQLTKQDIPGF